ncbi:MAG: hypothetical protein HYZ65_02925 [Burkholderiales bacterium]|nr:hypothetical protein [Burkholderiales bacterium]
MKRLLATLLLSCAALAQAAEVRFDSHYFFQSEQVMAEKKIDLQQLVRYSRKVQWQVWNTMKKVKLPPSAGYLVLAVRADGEVASWLDMGPAVHAYYEHQILAAAQKVQALDVAQGVLVYAIKMSIDTPVHTRKPLPAPPDWDEAKKKMGDPDNIEELVLSVWPE